MSKEFRNVPINLIDRDPAQPRTVFDEAALAELSESIKEHGVIQPIAVNPVNGRYQIIYGERRWLASTMAGLETIPAIVGDETEVFIKQIIENQFQQPLTPIEEARAFQELKEQGYTNAKLAHEFSRSLPYIGARLALLELDAGIQDLVEQSLWPVDPRATKALLSVKNAEVRVALAKEMSSPRVNIPTVQAACKAARAQIKAQQTKQETAVSKAEAIKVLTEQGTAVPQDAGKRTHEQVRQAAKGVCSDCAWKVTAGVTEPAWTVILEATNQLCGDCRAKIRGDLTICRECPAPLLLKELIDAGGRHDA